MRCGWTPNRSIRRLRNLPDRVADSAACGPKHHRCKISLIVAKVSKDDARRRHLIEDLDAQMATAREEHRVVSEELAAGSKLLAEHSKAAKVAGKASKKRAAARSKATNKRTRR